jgi:predicted enzyme related to lactoylglutathione lyase
VRIRHFAAGRTRCGPSRNRVRRNWKVDDLIKDIAFTVYPCKDVAATRAWYERTFGLTFAGACVEDGVEKYNEAHLPAGCFSLMASEWAGREPGSAAAIAFEVEDLDDAIRTLREQGIALEETFDGPVCRQTSLADPEGNKVTLHQRKRPS